MLNEIKAELKLNPTAYIGVDEVLDVLRRSPNLTITAAIEQAICEDLDNQN